MKIEDCKAGDRVVCYMSERIPGTVEKIEDDLVLVIPDRDPSTKPLVMPQQLRRLIKKPRKRFWICKYKGDNICGVAACCDATMKKRGCLEVVTVGKKNEKL